MYEIAPLGTQVMDTIRQLMSALDRNKFARLPVEGTGSSLKDFCSHHSKRFDGRGDHIHAKN
jgi:hypothetical protein